MHTVGDVLEPLANVVRSCLPLMWGNRLNAWFIRLNWAVCFCPLNPFLPRSCEISGRFPCSSNVQAIMMKMEKGRKSLKGGKTLWGLGYFFFWKEKAFVLTWQQLSHKVPNDPSKKKKKCCLCLQLMIILNHLICQLFCQYKTCFDFHPFIQKGDIFKLTLRKMNTDLLWFNTKVFGRLSWRTTEMRQYFIYCWTEILGIWKIWE